MNHLENQNNWNISIKFLLFSTLILGVGYPLTITVFAGSFFKKKANGSILNNEKGSELLSQKMTKPGFFIPRPSAGNFETMPSGASQLSNSSSTLREQIESRKNELIQLGVNPDLCKELLFTSGSGLDPHITITCAVEQARVIAIERNIEIKEVINLIDSSQENSIFGFIGRKRVNVQLLNQALEKNYK